MKKVYITGIRGFLGNSVASLFRREGYDVRGHSHEQLDLADGKLTGDILSEIQPDVVVHCAGRVGGMLFNRNAQFDQLADNFMIDLSVLQACLKAKVPKLIFCSSSCLYPSAYWSPYATGGIWDGLPDPNNLGYGLAKRMGLTAAGMVRDDLDVVGLIFPNLYGPGDVFKEDRSHFVPGIIQKVHTAKESNAPAIPMLGSGNAERELLYVEDAALACLFATNSLSRQDLNVGDGKLHKIKDVAWMIAREMGYFGELEWEPTGRNDGQARKCMESSLIRFRGWKPQTDLISGLQNTVKYFREEVARDLVHA